MLFKYVSLIPTFMCYMGMEMGAQEPIVGTLIYSMVQEDISDKPVSRDFLVVWL